MNAPPSTPAVERRTQIEFLPLAPLLARIRAAYQPEEIWLFGSRARGDARPDSDWDVFVVVPDWTSDEDLDPLRAWRLQREAGIPADVIPVPSRAPTPVAPHSSHPRRGPAGCPMSAERAVIAAYVRIADSDLRSARVLAQNGLRNAWYELEQAAEKLIRAVLTSEGIMDADRG